MHGGAIARYFGRILSGLPVKRCRCVRLRSACNVDLVPGYPTGDVATDLPSIKARYGVLEGEVGEDAVFRRRTRTRTGSTP